LTRTQLRGHGKVDEIWGPGMGEHGIHPLLVHQLSSQQVLGTQSIQNLAG